MSAGTIAKPAADGLIGGLFSMLLFAFGLSVFVTCCSIYKLTRMMVLHVSSGAVYRRGARE